ncbi:TlpA family protein disulfide reductase [Caldithrix abyssi]|uniref:Alkyl hydroperoxide reductase/ Thiol specific antioxidant/ Mal allergen n=2 Tax=Caldithrix abyssi TaxID=187145 RepID=H1XU56_CALAY|nr:redoxin domain-containing protein [Caldithrix abyssi]EHO41546.1 alkyl hydroperoxide reductase/ Thiol specific antioxidant/ Mal allergen [Caldithrix abyssi DSM 13497]
MKSQLDRLMTRIVRASALVVVNLLLMVVFSFAGQEGRTVPPDSVVDFTLKDANKKEFRLAEHLGQIMILSFIPNTKNKTLGARWLENSRFCVQKLKSKFNGDIMALGLKEMTDFPMFLPRSFIRAKLRKEPFPYLIDWEGKVFAQFAVQSTPVLMVVDAGGKIVYRQELTADTDRFNALCTQIEALIEQQQRSEKKAASREEENE